MSGFDGDVQTVLLELGQAGDVGAVIEQSLDDLDVAILAGKVQWSQLQLRATAMFLVMRQSRFSHVTVMLLVSRDITL